MTPAVVDALVVDTLLKVVVGHGVLHVGQLAGGGQVAAVGRGGRNGAGVHQGDGADLALAGLGALAVREVAGRVADGELTVGRGVARAEAGAAEALAEDAAGGDNVRHSAVFDQFQIGRHAVGVDAELELAVAAALAFDDVRHGADIFIRAAGAAGHNALVNVDAAIVADLADEVHLDLAAQLPVGLVLRRLQDLFGVGLQLADRGFTYREDITEKLGIDMSQVTKPEDLTAVFAKVKEAYPDMTIIDPNRANALFESYLGKIDKIDPLGDNIASPVSGVAYQDNATVVDMYETTDFKELCELTRSWFEAGYYASDAATTTATTAELLMSGNCFGTFCGLGNPKIAQQYTNNYGHPFENVQISDSMIWSGNGGAWMVNSGCKDPSAACKFMNLLYTDAYVDNLLVYGEEGVDYKLDENGCAVAPDGYTDLNSVAYTNNMNYYFWGNKWLTYPVAGGLYGEEKETNKQQNYDGDHSNYYGFLYDYSDKEAEYTACQNIVEEYKKSLWVGAADVDTTLAEMTKRLKAAGMDDLIQAKQEQLDAWMSSK